MVTYIYTTISEDVLQFLLKVEHEWLTKSSPLFTHFNLITQNVCDKDQEVGPN
jgi:hypothetical protein